MSSVLKKIVKHVKKVFKKIVKVVKKVLKSKIFKVIALAVAVYFTAGAAAGWLGAAGTAGAGTAAAGTVAGLTPVVTTTASGLAAAAAPSLSAAAAASTSTGILSTIGAAASSLVPTTAGGMLLGSAALTTGGNMLSAYSQSKAAEEAQDERDENGKHKLNVYDTYKATVASHGPQTDEQGSTVYEQQGQEAPINTEQSPQKFYNPSADAWSPVQKAAQRSAPTARTV